MRYKDLLKKAGEGRGRDGAAVGAREAGAGLKVPDLCLAPVPGTVGPGRKMVSSWQARLPGNSLSNRVITQLPLPNLGSHHLLLQGLAAGVGLEEELSKVFFGSSRHPHLSARPLAMLSSPLLHESHTLTSIPHPILSL